MGKSRSKRNENSRESSPEAAAARTYEALRLRGGVHSFSA